MYLFVTDEKKFGEAVSNCQGYAWTEKKRLFQPHIRDRIALIIGKYQTLDDPEEVFRSRHGNRFQERGIADTGRSHFPFLSPRDPRRSEAFHFYMVV